MSGAFENVLNHGINRTSHAISIYFDKRYKKGGKENVAGRNIKSRKKNMPFIDWDYPDW